MSPQALEQCLPANESISGAGCAAGSQFNSNLYYELIDPLAPFSLTGTLWCKWEIAFIGAAVTRYCGVTTDKTLRSVTSCATCSWQTDHSRCLTVRLFRGAKSR